MDAQFERLTVRDDGAWPIYDLAPSLSPLHEAPPGEIRDPQSINFGDTIQFRGIALHKLLDRPATYDVTSYWECLKKPTTNLVMRILVTKPSGQVVDREERLPRGGRAPTSTWNLGDIVRDRCILVLPNSLSDGEYQIWLGWSDPINGQKLRISGKEDATLVARIKVLRPTTPGWLSSE